VLAWVYLRPVSQRLALVLTGVDVVAISVLALLSGGAYSHARLAFFLVPVTVAFRFRPAITAVAALITTVAYLAQAVAHPARNEPEAARFILTQAGYLAWLGAACALLSLLLARRTTLVEQLAAERSQLLADALEAEQRERRVLAESLHDHALQNLLSARHELQEAGESASHPALERADTALVETVGQLRDAVVELHPYVLDQAGLAAAIRSVAQQSATHAGIALDLDLHETGRTAADALVFSAARELLSNVVRHADATRVSVALVETEGVVSLTVADDGDGFPESRLAERLGDGHVGLASQRVRVEAAGGTMRIDSAPGEGTSVAIRVPVG
jgi:two-component system, NarL family, sensor kinase